METTLSERLRMFAEYKQLSVRAFELSCGLSSGYVRGIKHTVLPDKRKKILAKYPELNEDWLLTGNGQMLNENYPNSAISGEQNEKNAEKSNTIQQGISREQAEEKPTTDKEIILNLLQTVHDKDVIIAKQAEEICQLREKIARLEAEQTHIGSAATDVQKRPAASE